MKNTGTLYGVSVGPGDPLLITLKAVQIIEACPALAVPQTKNANTLALSIAGQVCDLGGKEILYLDFPMSKDAEVLQKNYAHVAERICSCLSNGTDVAFLTLGDISIYSTFSYVARLVEKAGYTVVSCAGVTSFCAAAAELNRPLVQGKEALIVMPADTPDAKKLMEANATKVLMKSSRRADAVAGLFREKSMIAVENCGLKTQRIYTDVEELLEESGYFTTIIVREKADE